MAKWQNRYGDTMGQFDDLLKEITEKRWETYQQTKTDPNECGFSEGDKCNCCMHPLDCPLDNEAYIKEQKRLRLEYDLGQWKELLNIVYSERQAMGLPLEGVLPKKSELPTHWANPYYQVYPKGTWLDDPKYSPRNIQKVIRKIEKELNELDKSD